MKPGIVVGCIVGGWRCLCQIGVFPARAGVKIWIAIRISEPFYACFAAHLLISRRVNGLNKFHSQIKQRFVNDEVCLKNQKLASTQPLESCSFARHLLGKPLSVAHLLSNTEKKTDMTHIWKIKNRKYSVPQESKKYTNPYWNSSHLIGLKKRPILQSKIVYGVDCQGHKTRRQTGEWDCVFVCCLFVVERHVSWKQVNSTWVTTKTCYTSFAVLLAHHLNKKTLHTVIEENSALWKMFLLIQVSRIPKFLQHFFLLSTTPSFSS